MDLFRHRQLIEDGTLLKRLTESHNALGAAVVDLQLFLPIVNPLLCAVGAKIREAIEIRALEAVDGLVVIANHGEAASRIAQPVGMQQKLDGIAVLELVHEDVAKLIRQQVLTLRKPLLDRAEIQNILFVQGNYSPPAVLFPIGRKSTTSVERLTP